MLAELKRRREINKLERTIPNPRSASPRGDLRPMRRDSYLLSVIRVASMRLLILTVIVVGFCVAIYLLG